MRRALPLLLMTATTVLAHGAGPVPVTTIDGLALSFDFPAVRIGVAEYDEGPTGATVFHFAKPVLAAVDVRGGAPATINTDTLRLSRNFVPGATGRNRCYGSSSPSLMGGRGR